MGQTPNYHLRYAELADPADANVATKNLADDVDAALGIVAALPSNIPGQVILWPGAALPTVAKYGHWAWCDGAVYPTATYPDCAGNIAPVWRTFAGAADPGAGNFRVPDLRAYSVAGADPMVQGATKTNRLVRASATGAFSGVEYVTLTAAQLAAHAHGVSDPSHAHSIADPSHTHAQYTENGGPAQVGSHYNQRTDGATGQYQVEGNPWTGYSGTGIGIYGAGTGIAIQNAGGGGAHENVPPTVYVPYICFLG